MGAILRRILPVGFEGVVSSFGPDARTGAGPLGKAAIQSLSFAKTKKHRSQPQRGWKRRAYRKSETIDVLRHLKEGDSRRRG
jgi:hypothetical protein